MIGDRRIRGVIVSGESLYPLIPRYGLLCFLPNAPQFGEHTAFLRQKASQSLDCCALQDGVLQHGHHSVAHTVGEKQRTWRRVLTCRCGIFVAFFMTRTIL